jgi:hypothetical protein
LVVVFLVVKRSYINRQEVAAATDLNPHEKGRRELLKKGKRENRCYFI